MDSPRKRILVKDPGDYRAFSFDETPIDDPGSNEVQVEVKACGVNFADIAVRLGLYAAARGLYPICPGLEFSGIVRQVGSGVNRFAPGDPVFGACRFGGYATALNCPAEHLWGLPEDWDFARGAAFPVAYLTAFYALYNVGHLKPSDTVLVHSAAGGVGTALLHLLRKNGNRSAAVVGRSEKASAAQAAGANFVIDKRTEDLWRRAEAFSPDGFDVVLDANGASTLKGSYDHLKPGGRLLIYGFASMFSPSGRKNYLKLLWYYFRTVRFSPFDLTGANKTVSGFNLIYLFDRVDLFRSIMDALLNWASNGDLPAMPTTAFPFEDPASAHKHMESGKSVGKLVLVNK